ncbi:hypothetical protein [Streptomyces niveus]|uniref:hypothetical protein n=1 Tax=Streptomyces niveus TaxID=193462 RepID=UPI00365B2361
MALHHTGVPGQGEAGGDSVEIAREMLSEVAEAGQFGGDAGRFDPFGEPVAVQVGEQVSEGAHVFGERRQSGAVGQGGFELDPVAFR